MIFIIKNDRLLIYLIDSKYIYCLNSSYKAQEEVAKKLKEFLPDSMEVKFVNPQGILLAGRSNTFDREQLRFRIDKAAI